MSQLVAKALHALRLNVRRVGWDDGLTVDSGDADILAYAIKTNQVIVTQNHDMIVLCARAGVPLVWFDPMDKDMSRQAQARMCLDHIADWQEAIAKAPGPICVVARKTKWEVITLEEAERRALARGKRRRRQLAPRKPKPPPAGDDHLFDG